MLSFLKQKSDCVGCGACKAACPTNCIEFKIDAEGFVYPEANDKCIKCDKCLKVCPVAHAHEKKEQKHEAYAAVSKDYSVWKKSASGGAFSELCAVFGDEKTLICGAAWKGLSVEHICVEGVAEIAPLRKSKYVQSDTKDTYKQIKDRLNNGGKAIFCGTPCQVAGLKHYLGKDYENLLLIDFICHGVGSPKVFQESIKIIEKQFGKKIKSYGFRAKRKVHELDYLTEYVFENDKKTYFAGKDPYIKLFLSQNALRPCCGKNCAFRNEYRYGDVTIADFKGLTKVFPQLRYEKRNYSSVIFNTEKGLLLKDKLSEKMEMLPCAMEDIGKFNPLFFRNTRPSEDRDTFFAEFSENPEKALKKWGEPVKMFKVSLKRSVYDAMPMVIRRIMFKIFRGVK